MCGLGKVGGVGYVGVVDGVELEGWLGCVGWLCGV